MSYHSNPLSTRQAPHKKLQIALVNAIHNNKTYLLEVSYWITISELKSKIEKAFGIPVAQQRLFFQTQELNHNNFSMISFGRKKKVKIILRPTPNLENTLGLIKIYETLPKEESLEALFFSAQEGFNLGLIPKLTFNGTSGSYFLQNKYRKSVAIFKPFDEEPFAPNNPKGYIGKLGSPGFRAGVMSGESAIREVAAYLFDSRGFSSVPPTTFVEVVHPYFSKRDMKEVDIDNSQANSIIPIQNFSQYAGQDKKFVIKHGSLQKFVGEAEEASDYGPKMFPDEEVRKIAILDIRILNCDRNEGNILVKKEKGGFRLIPIDHGLSFPDSFQACTYDLVWMEWPQAKKQWTSIELDYLSRIDPKGDVEKLSKHFKFREICLRNVRIAEIVLTKGATAGLTLYDIGTLLYRNDPDFPSPIEEIIRKTEELYHTIKTSVPKGVLFIGRKPPKRKCLKGDIIQEEEKENGRINPAKCLPSFSRTRAFSENIDTLPKEAHQKKVFQSILEQTSQSNDLFIIPEMTQPSRNDAIYKHQQIGKLGMSNKTSFISKGSSKGGESDDSYSEEESDNDNSFNYGKQAKLLRRSSSIPAALAKMASNENLAKENGGDEEELKEKSVFYSSKRAAIKGLSRYQEKKEHVPLHMDELFFKYFTGFLEQKIEIMMKSRQLPPTRSRFYSDI